MKTEDALAECEQTVRRFDPDRYFASLFAPAERRPLLFALYAFNHEIARLGEAVREPMIGEIRLQWWREAVEAARDGHPRAHPACVGMAELFARVGPPLEPFNAMIDARAFDASPASFPDLSALEAYCDATSGGLMRIAASALDADVNMDALARDAGAAYALTGILRAIPFHASRHKLYLPVDMLAAESLLPEDAISGRDSAKLARVVQRIAARAGAHWAAARKFALPGHAFGAVLPASLVPLYLKRLKRPGFDPFRASADVALYRRQFTLLRAAVLGRL
jgi:phytoene synthase